jgi:uncharacterized protein
MANDEDGVDPYVSVRGEAALDVEAEVAHLTITVNARDRKRETAVDQLTRRNATVLARVAEFGEAIETVETTGLRVHPWYREGRPTDRVDGYVAQTTHTLAIVDFTLLGDVAIAVADEDDVTLFGPMWGLRRDSDAYRQARLQAVQDAVGRARDYAAALGSTVTGLVHLADVGLLGDGATPYPGGAVSVARMAGTAEPSPPLTLEPQRQVAAARIEARFTIAPPDLG